MLQKIQDRFTESIHIQIIAAESLPSKLAQAAEKMVHCLLQGNKIIVCGDGRSYGNAQLLVSNLLHRYDLVRPSLAAHLLQLDGMLMSYLSQENQLGDMYKKQLASIAQAGDVFVAFTPLGNEVATHQAIHTANNENMSIIAFTSSRNDHTQGLLREEDIELSFPSINEMRIIEGHQFCVNLLCESVDNLLFSPTASQ
ncbi:MAG: SIS domain-containing protein [Pasteurellaceae bacterium]|nr:SIS domain-containing protein [Pasteurellaceae bacterium]